MKALSASEVAASLGVSRDYLYEHWREMRRMQKFPPPTIEGKGHLHWDAAQLYAWLDRHLTREQRVLSATYRAAEAAARAAIVADPDAPADLAEHRRALAAKFAPPEDRP